MPVPGMVRVADSSGSGGGSSSSWRMRSSSKGVAESLTRSRTVIDRATSRSPSNSEARTTWRRRPSRTTSVSPRRGRIGAPRMSSTVCRQIRIGTAMGTTSTRWARIPATDPPCCSAGFHGPPASGPGTTRSPSTWKKESSDRVFSIRDLLGATTEQRQEAHDRRGIVGGQDRLGEGHPAGAGPGEEVGQGQPEVETSGGEALG